jgi:pyruvate,water dikinase
VLGQFSFAFSNRLPYYQMRPAGAPAEAVGHPSREIWDEIARSHP